MNPNILVDLRLIRKTVADYYDKYQYDWHSEESSDDSWGPEPESEAFSIDSVTPLIPQTTTRTIDAILLGKAYLKDWDRIHLHLLQIINPHEYIVIDIGYEFYAVRTSITLIHTVEVKYSF